MFKIIWNDGTKWETPFASLDWTIRFGKGTGAAFKVVDQNDQVVHEENGFIIKNEMDKDRQLS